MIDHVERLSRYAVSLLCLLFDDKDGTQLSVFKEYEVDDIDGDHGLGQNASELAMPGERRGKASIAK